MIQTTSFDNLPDRIKRLGELATNLWWSWNPEARSLFRLLNQKLWYKSKHNPIWMIHALERKYLERKANDPEFLEVYDDVLKRFDRELARGVEQFVNHPIAYFSFEFGLHQSLPIYSGGLGVLSGDTVKEAADMHLNFIAIGFLYHQGYFRQKIPSHGMQEADFPHLKFDRIPVFPVLDPNGDRMKLIVKLNDEDVIVQVWKIKLAANNLYLMDTDIDENKPWFRGLSARLYGGDYEMRINQEYLLASAGHQLLNRLGIQPAVYHLNEGHCAFISIKRIEQYVEEGMSYDNALKKVRKTTVFTTHTPVPAGHDKFGFDTIENKFLGTWEKLGISREEFLNLGMETDSIDYYNMTVLAMKTSVLVNGVSELHTQVTKKMFDDLLTKNENQLVAITNGVHTPSWVAGPMRRVLITYLGESWQERLEDQSMLETIHDIPVVEFWEARKQSKRDLFATIREGLRKKRAKGSRDAEQLIAGGALLDPEVLTIGFARRFATYKRANLIFRDINRFRKIITNSEQPVQVIFAGKAHPADEQGKQVLREVYEQAMNRENNARVVFIENYDTHIGRLMVSGVDVWMNTPKRPHEASGTSGMKAANNGVPHFSISDGWWAEGFNENNGWVIGNSHDYEGKERDEFDAESIYSTLEDEIIPTYYDRNKDDIPLRWVSICKEAMIQSLYKFSTRRMMKDYIAKMYKPSLESM